MLFSPIQFSIIFLINRFIFVICLFVITHSSIFPSRDPKSRPYAKDLLNHPFITNESQSITKQANYRIRRSIETINKRLSQTIEKANEVRSEFHTIWTFILSLLIFAIAAMMAIFLKQNWMFKDSMLSIEILCMDVNL